jgi:hypothetical protein
MARDRCAVTVPGAMPSVSAVRDVQVEEQPQRDDLPLPDRKA